MCNVCVRGVLAQWEDELCGESMRSFSFTAPTHLNPIKKKKSIWSIIMLQAGGPQ